MMVPLPSILTVILLATSRSSSCVSKGKQQHAEETTVVILYNKPADVITSHSDQDALPSPSSSQRRAQRRKTVYDQIMSMEGYVSGDDESDAAVAKKQFEFHEVSNIQSKLHAIGRLDVDTTGLLLLTNDGGLVHHVTNPTTVGALSQERKDSKQQQTLPTQHPHHHRIQKTYEAIIMGCHDVSSQGLQLIRNQGVDLGPKHGGKTLPADDLQVLGHPTHKSTKVRITLSQGKNRQIRRMFHAIGSGVMKLKRTQIGPILTLSGVEKEGQWRLLTSKEIELGLGWKPRLLERLPTSIKNESSRRTTNLNRKRQPGRRRRR